MDETRPIERQVGDALQERDERVAVAESLTGGLIGARLTAVPGSSEYFDRSMVTYAYDAKREVLAVSRESLDEYGAVSAPVAQEMAQGVRDTAETAWGVSATGVAGPGGGTDNKPVGLTYIGIAYAAPWGSEESYTRAERFVFDGDRSAVREASVRSSLEQLMSDIESRNSTEQS
jgi:competence/damage-inducible protein CinA C-terminal domain